MNSEQIADNVKLIRKTLMPESAALATINALVDLLCESHDGLNKFWHDEWYSGNEDCSDLIRKLTTIAALKEKV